VFEFHDHPVAARLLKRAALEIERLVSALDKSGALPVALCGGLAVPYEPFVPAALRERVRAPRADSAAGALELARRAASAFGAAGRPAR
jgi:glucosamine kinase